MSDVNNYTYFVYDPDRDLIKIGQSKDPEKRLQALQIEFGKQLTIIAMVEDHSYERELHDRFADLRVEKEWFKNDKQIRDFAHKRRDGFIFRPRSFLTIDNTSNFRRREYMLRSRLIELKQYVPNMVRTSVGLEIGIIFLVRFVFLAGSFLLSVVLGGLIALCGFLFVACVLNTLGSIAEYQQAQQKLKIGQDLYLFTKD